MNAQDIMTRDVVTVTPDTPVPAIVRLLLARGISGVPVVDAEQKVVGLVSEGDLLRRAELGTEKRRGSWLSFFTGSSTLASDFVRAHGTLASDVMTRNVICIDATTPLPEIADLMEEKKIKRVPVLDNGRLVGLVSRANLLRAFASRLETADATAPATDAAIRERLLDALAHQSWSRRTENSVVVTHGVVHLWGLVGTPEESRALQLAAAEIPGVTAVQNHTIILSEEPYPIFPGSFGS